MTSRYDRQDVSRFAPGEMCAELVLCSMEASMPAFFSIKNVWTMMVELLRTSYGVLGLVTLIMLVVVSEVR